MWAYMKEGFKVKVAYKKAKAEIEALLPKERENPKGALNYHGWINKGYNQAIAEMKQALGGGE